MRQFRRKPPAKQSKLDWPKLEAKMARNRRADESRRRKLVLMTAEEFVAYGQTTKARKGHHFRRMIEREIQRRGLTTAQVMGTSAPTLMTSAPPRPPNPEHERLGREIEHLKSLLAAAEAAEHVGGDAEDSQSSERQFATAMRGGPSNAGGVDTFDALRPGALTQEQIIEYLWGDAPENGDTSDAEVDPDDPTRTGPFA